MIADLFKTRTHDSSTHARAYLSGLLSRTERKNMERMSESLHEVKHQDLQQFLTDSPWEAAALWKWVGIQASERFGGGSKNTLLIDESAFAKKGKSSVGVARQHNGRLGKVDNCQVGVFSALSLGRRVALVGARLYLPDEWTKSGERMDRVGVPKDQRKTRTRNQLAWELIEEARKNGIEFGWVGMDAVYGRDQGLLLNITASGLKFVADVDVDQLVWEDRPAEEVRPKNMRVSGARTVQEIWEENRRKVRVLRLRGSENGPVEVEFWAKRVWIWPKECEIPVEVWLLVSVRADGTVKYSLSNAPENMSWKELAIQQGQRYFIERSFQDAKTELGMADYQARKWLAWHHHMALVGAAMWIALEERMLNREANPLTTTRDVVEILAWHFQKPRQPKKFQR